MVGNNNNNNNKKPNRKTLAAKKKHESRTFKRLTRSFATKLGVEETTRSTAAANSATTRKKGLTKEQRRRLRKERATAKRATAEQLNKNEHELLFDQEFAGVMERERAKQQQKKKKRGAGKTKLRKQRKQQAANHQKQEHNSDGQLHFQPPIFSLQKSTTDLLNDAVTRMDGFGLQDNNNGASFIPLNNTQTEWNSRNPNHPAASINNNNNPYSSLEERHEQTNQGGGAAANQKSFSFQPATFAVAAAANTNPHQEVDPDL